MATNNLATLGMVQNIISGTTPITKYDHNIVIAFSQYLIVTMVLSNFSNEKLTIKDIYNYIDENDTVIVGGFNDDISVTPADHIPLLYMTKNSDNILIYYGAVDNVSITQEEFLAATLIDTPKPTLL